MPVLSPLPCFPPNVVATSRSFSHAVSVRALDAVWFAAQRPLACTTSTMANSSRLSLAIVPRPCLGFVTVCKGPVRITSRARLRRSGQNRRRQRWLLALQLLPREPDSAHLVASGGGQERFGGSSHDAEKSYGEGEDSVA